MEITTVQLSVYIPGDVTFADLRIGRDPKGQAVRFSPEPIDKVIASTRCHMGEAQWQAVVAQFEDHEAVSSVIVFALYHEAKRCGALIDPQQEAAYRDLVLAAGLVGAGEEGAADGWPAPSSGVARHTLH